MRSHNGQHPTVTVVKCAVTSTLVENNKTMIPQQGLHLGKTNPLGISAHSPEEFFSAHEAVLNGQVQGHLDSPQGFFTAQDRQDIEHSGTDHDAGGGDAKCVVEVADFDALGF
jgi:hypothetical protein